MARGLCENDLTHHAAHAVFVESLDGILLIRVQARFELSVRCKSDAVTGGAEMAAHRANEADVPLRTGEPVEFCHTVVPHGLRELRQRFEHRVSGNVGVRAKG